MHLKKVYNRQVEPLRIISAPVTYLFQALEKVHLAEQAMQDAQLEASQFAVSIPARLTCPQVTRSSPCNTRPPNMHHPSRGRAKYHHVRTG